MRAVGGRSAERSWGSLKKQVPDQREKSLTLTLLAPLSVLMCSLRQANFLLKMKENCARAGFANAWAQGAVQTA